MRKRYLTHTDSAKPLQSPPNMASLLRSTSSLCPLLILSFLYSGLSALDIVSATTVHDILADNGLPKGLIPSSVKSYSLKDNGEFEVELQGECYVQFQRVVYYSSKITGKLAFGSIKDLTGIQAKKAFIWVSVSSIELNYADKTVEFHVGPFTEELPMKDFETIPTCKKGVGAAASVPKKPCRGFGLLPESFFVSEE